jgi:hypothetical protein
MYSIPAVGKRLPCPEFAKDFEKKYGRHQEQQAYRSWVISRQT